MIKMYNIRCAPVVPSIYCLLRTECDRKPSASEDVRTRTVWTRRTYVFYFQIFHHAFGKVCRVHLPYMEGLAVPSYLYVTY